MWVRETWAKGPMRGRLGPPSSAAPWSGPLRGRDFRLLALSTGLSSLGDELALIALTIKVAELTDSGWAVAALLLAGSCRS